MGDDRPKVVDTVEKTLKSGGENATQDAYKAFKDDYDSYAKSHSAQETQTYLQQVTEALNKSNPGALPKMALEWANQAAGDTFLTGGKNRFEHSQLQGIRDAKADDRIVKSGYVNGLDQAMAGEVLKQWDQLKEDDNGWWFGGTDVITRDKLNDRLKSANGDLRFEKQQHDDREALKAEASKLFKSTDPEGKDSLFKVIDGIPGGKADGNLSKSDLERYRDEYNRHYNNTDGKYPWTKENADLVNKLIAGWDDPKNENYQLAQMVRGSSITKESYTTGYYGGEYGGGGAMPNRQGPNGMYYTSSDQYATEGSIKRALGLDPKANLYSEFNKKA